MESADTNIPGYGFDPTNEQLLTHYLGQRIVDHFNGASQGTHKHLIPDINLYEYDPKDLPSQFRGNSQAVPNRNHCFFFCRLNKKYRNSNRLERMVLKIGYWKATCKKRSLSDEDNGADLGTKNTLVFYRGRAPKGDRTGWVMHEYHLNPTCLGYKATKEMPFVLCRIKKKDDDEPAFDQGTSSNHGGYETQPSGDQDQQMWGSLPSIQNLASADYDHSLSYPGGYYNNNQVYEDGYGVAPWMPPSPYHNYQDYSNSWNSYN